MILKSADTRREETAMSLQEKLENFGTYENKKIVKAGLCYAWLQTVVLAALIAAITYLLNVFLPLL